jgi:hypothetical protein
VEEDPVHLILRSVGPRLGADVVDVKECELVRGADVGLNMHSQILEVVVGQAPMVALRAGGGVSVRLPLALGWGLWW